MANIVGIHFKNKKNKENKETFQKKPNDIFKCDFEKNKKIKCFKKIGIPFSNVANLFREQDQKNQKYHFKDKKN